MRLIGIETSERAAAIALRCDGATLEERTLPTAGRRHAQTLVPEIDALLKRHALTPRDCDGIAVSIGPGSFTGLRVGIVCAKTFAYATGCRIAAVETFAAIAENAPPDVAGIWVVGDAQRGNLYVARYQRSELGDMQRQGEFGVIAGEEWLSAQTPDETVTGPGLAKLENEMQLACRIMPLALRWAKAAQIAAIGERQLEQGRDANLWRLEPLYIRKSAAEEKRDAERPRESP